MPTYDAVIYGATPQSVWAAIVIARAGRTVGIVAPESVLGGMLTGGLGITDAPSTKTWWGVVAEFVDACSAITGFTNDRLSWNFAPSVAQGVIDAMIAAESNITLHLGEVVESVTRTQAVSTKGLDAASLTDRGNRIASIKTGIDTYDASVFIDASYTGELIAQAGVPHDLGREPYALYGEPPAGVRHEPVFALGYDLVDADGDLTKYGQFEPVEKQGDPDRKTMGTGFRYVVTNVSANSIGFPAPPGYNAADFADEIAFAVAENPTRYTRDVGFFFRRAEYDEVAAEAAFPEFATLSQTQRETAWHAYVDAAAMDEAPAKFLTNGSDIIGPLAWEYTFASEVRRAEIRAELHYRELGRFHTLANHPDVPQATRDSFSEIGFCADEFQTHFIGTAGFPHEMYHRQGRRLRGQKRVTFWDAIYQVNFPDQIAHGGYFIDSKAKTQYAKADGGGTREGTYGEGSFTTSDGTVVEYEGQVYFGIPMGAVVPPHGVCDNLAAVWCLSASDVAFTAIRLEPFLSAVANAVGHMAVESLDSGTPLARLDYGVVRNRLDAAGADLYRYIDGANA